MLTHLPSYYKEGTLIVHNNGVGFVSYDASENEKPVFLPSLNDKKDLLFYQQYVSIRDAYFRLTTLDDNVEHSVKERRSMKLMTSFVSQYGILNSPVNHNRILKDEAFGDVILASLERKEGDQFIKADILTQSLMQKGNI